MNLSEWLLANRREGSLLSRRIVCTDGFSISVQANEIAYCAPRDNYGPWYEVECGFPSSVPELIMNYCEDAEKPTDTVYGYVPIDLVEELLQLHGGIDNGIINDITNGTESC